MQNIPDTPSITYDNRFNANWKHFAIIKESDIKSFTGKSEYENYNILFPLYDELTFKGKDVFVMTDKEDLVLKSKTLTRENSKMTLEVENDDCYIINHILKERHKIIEKEIKKEKYLFINLNNEIDNKANT